MIKAKKIYALYKGDELIADGTMHEIADKTGKTFNSIYFMSSPGYQQRVEKRRAKRGITNSLELIEIEEE